MDRLWECGVCKSIVPLQKINGECQSCQKNTCQNCQRICDRCQKIFCMFDIEVKLVMRQQQAHIHKLCKECQAIW